MTLTSAKAQIRTESDRSKRNRINKIHKGWAFSAEVLCCAKQHASEAFRSTICRLHVSSKLTRRPRRENWAANDHLLSRLYKVQLIGQANCKIKRNHPCQICVDYLLLNMIKHRVNGRKPDSKRHFNLFWSVVEVKGWHIGSIDWTKRIGSSLNGIFNLKLANVNLRQRKVALPLPYPKHWNRWTRTCVTFKRTHCGCQWIDERGKL